MANETVEETARSMGWRPKEQWKGEPDKFVDAEAFVRNGENFIPILRKRVSTAEERNQSLMGEVQGLKKTTQELQEALKTQAEYNAQIAKREAQLESRRLRAELIEARKEGDTTRELELEEQLEEHKEAIKAKPATTEKPTEAPAKAATDGVPDPTQAPEFQQFLADNPWFQSDPVMRAASVALGTHLAQTDPEFRGLTAARRYEVIAEQIKERFGETEAAPRKQNGKYDSGGGSPREGRRSGNSGNGKSYNDLPADAKAACDTFSRTLVGPNKAYKTKEDWQKKYAEDYDWSAS